MTTTFPAGVRLDLARTHFEASDYTRAATLLRELLEEVPDDLTVRLLLARAYYHSAQLRRAETEARTVVEADPVNAYAHLLLGRSLERQSRHAEASGPLRVAVAMGMDLTG